MAKTATISVLRPQMDANRARAITMMTELQSINKLKEVINMLNEEIRELKIENALLEIAAYEGDDFDPAA